MQKRWIEFSVGIFFLLGIVAFAMLAIRVSGLSQIYSLGESYVITADFDNIGGLKPRARVTMAGVTIGRVDAISFDPTNFVAKVTIDINEKINHIPNDSKASILTAGLLGDNYIGLTPGFSDNYLKSGDHIPVDDTEGAVVLEQLVQKFLSTQASGLGPAEGEGSEHHKANKLNELKKEGT
ncbi:MAG: outer membrane lipid asymmetry maintenance protein MlaD [Candidatus Berkiellales bacterium]